MAKHYLTITVRVLDYWFDLENELVYVLMELGNKLILVEREF